MTTKNTPIPDLNDIIVSAVQGRVEASVLAQLTDSETFGALVVAALQQQVEVPDGTSYGKKRISFMNHTVQRTIQEATKAEVAAQVAELAPAIRAEVAKAMKKSVGVIAESLVSGFVASAEGRYPSIKVEFAGKD